MKPNCWRDRRPAATGVILGLVLFLSWAHPASAQDNPTRGPLRVDPRHGSTFVDRDGIPVWLSGALSCCMADGDESGWPWVSEALLLRIAEAKNNYASIRVGPYTRRLESWPFEAYAFSSTGGCDDPGDCYNLNEWTHDFWRRLRERVDFARERGIYVEVDLPGFHDRMRRSREEVLARGGSRPALESFIAFRGRAPQIDALLRHNGMSTS